MADIILKDRDGNDEIYEGITKVKFNTTDGGTQMFMEGESTTSDITPDFSQGDMVVVPEEGKFFSEVTVLKPTALTPENIAKDVNVAGIVGTLEAGGGGDCDLKTIAERTLSGIVEDSNISFVGDYAFYGMSQITGISFPNVSSIGYAAFQGCSNLLDANFENTENAKGYALAYCSQLKSASLPKISSMPQSMFYSCGELERVTLGCDSNFNNTITSGAFAYCSKLSEIKFVYSGSYVEAKFALGANDLAFAGCKSLTSIHLVGKYASYGGAEGMGYAPIGQYCFDGCAELSSVVIDGCLGGERMSASQLSSLTKDIEVCAFRGCSKLSSISLKVTGQIGLAVGSSAFYGCNKLQDVWIDLAGSYSGFNSASFYLGDSAFDDTPMTTSTYTGEYGSIHVPKSIYANIRLASGWQKYSTRMVSY